MTQDILDKAIVLSKDIELTERSLDFWMDDDEDNTLFFEDVGISTKASKEMKAIAIKSIQAHLRKLRREFKRL